MNSTEKIKIVLTTLNTITVSGRKNLDCLLGSMQVLEQVIKELEAKTNDAETD